MYRISYIIMLWQATIITGAMGIWIIWLGTDMFQLLMYAWLFGTLASFPAVSILCLLFLWLRKRVTKSLVIRLIVLAFTAVSIFVTFWIVYRGKDNAGDGLHIQGTLIFLIPATIFSLILPIENKEQVVSP